MSDYLYTINGASLLLGVHKDTLRRYERLGLLTPPRECHGYRVYTLSDLKDVCRKVAETKGVYFDKAPKLRRGDVYCAKCMRDWKKAELRDIEIAKVCPRCGRDALLIEVNSLSTT